MRWAALGMLLSMIGCGASGHGSRMNNLSLGMSKDQVIRILGKPRSTSAMDNTKYFRYLLFTEFVGNEEYYVAFQHDTVTAYGKLGDFATPNLIKNSTNVQINQVVPQR